jgi:hypothetical protein
MTETDVLASLEREPVPRKCPTCRRRIVAHRDGGLVLHFRLVGGRPELCPGTGHPVIIRRALVYGVAAPGAVPGTSGRPRHPAP